MAVTSPLRSQSTEPSFFDQIALEPQFTPEMRRQVLGDNEDEYTKGLRRGAAGLTSGSYASEALRDEVAGRAAESAAAVARAKAVQDESQAWAPRVGSLRDIGSVGDAADFAAGAVGQGTMSMAPTLAAALLTRGRGPIGKAASFLGAAVPAYEIERGEAAQDQYTDPVLSKASAQERDRAASVKGLINAGLESIVPAGLSGSILRKPTSSFLGHLGKEALTEGATEGAQEVVGWGAKKYIDPNRELDPWDVANAIASGALTGAHATAVTQGPTHALSAMVPDTSGVQAKAKAAFDAGASALSAGAGKAVDLATTGIDKTQELAGKLPSLDEAKDAVAGVLPKRSAPGEEPSLFDKLAGLGEAVGARVGDATKDIDLKAPDALKGVPGKAKDFVGDTLDRMTEATKNATSATDFIKQVFNPSIADAAAGDLNPTDPATLRGASMDETAANVSKDDAARAARAAQYAQELLDDPATPAAVRQRVAGFGTDFSSPEAQGFVTRNLVAQRGGEKVANIVNDALDIGKKLMTGPGGKLTSALADRIIKRNMQGADSSDSPENLQERFKQAQFQKALFEGLTDEAKASPVVRAKLGDLADTLIAFAGRTGNMTKDVLPALTKMSDAMALFKDPQTISELLTKQAGVKNGMDSFLSKIKNVTSAQQELKQPDGFLYSSLTPEAKDSLTAPQLTNVARLIDNFTVEDMPGREGVSKRGDQIVNGLAQIFGSPENARTVLDYYAQQNRAHLQFDPNEGEGARPMDSDEYDYGDGGGGRPLTEHDASELTPSFRSPNVNRPFLRGRDTVELAKTLLKGGDMARVSSLAEHVKATGQSAKFKAGDIRRYLQKRLNDDMMKDTGSVKSAIEALEAHLSDPNELIREEPRQMLEKLKAAKTEDRSANVKALRAEIKAFDTAREEAAKAGKDPDEAALGLYDVALSREDETKASDEQITAFRQLLDRTTSGRSAESVKQNALKKATGVTFTVDGKKLKVSLESMIYNSPVKGSLRERLLASLALMAHRADGMPEIPDSAVVKRSYHEDGSPLTWGQFKSMPANQDVSSVESRGSERGETDPEKLAERAKMDDISASNLRAYLRDSAPKDQGSVEVGTTLLARVEKQLDKARDSKQWAAVKELGSKARVLKAFINESLDADYPLDTETLLGNLAQEDTDRGVSNSDQAKPTAYKNILAAEARMQAYRDRMEAVAGTSLESYYEGKAQELATQLDKDLSALQPWERMNETDRPSGSPDALKGSQYHPDSPQARREREEYGRDPSALRPDPLKRVKVKPLPPAASTRQKAEAVNDHRALSPDAYTALHDVAVKDQWERLNTPAKVMRFAEMLHKGLAQIERTPALELSKEQADILDSATVMRGEDSGAFWNALMEQAGGSPAEVKALGDFIKEQHGPKAEPGITRLSTMDPGQQAPGKVDTQSIIDEIARMRGKDVAVAFAKFADMGASGEFSMNENKTNRLIRIAIDSLDPMSVAYHESLHDFFSMLGDTPGERKLRADLAAAVEAPQVRDQLRELLKDHPAALEQIAESREEALAYAFQFWATGKLGLPAPPATLFGRVAQFLREMLGVMTQGQKVQAIFAALHEGRFADQSLVPAVLKDMKAQTLDDKVKELMGPLADVSEQLLSGTTDRLRNTGNEALIELADLFHREPGREKGRLPFLQSRAQEVGKRLNQLQRILEGSTNEDRQQALEDFQNMREQTTGVGTALASYLEEMRQYMVDKGVKKWDAKNKEWADFGNIEKYFPRVWDKNSIRNNATEFIALLGQYISPAQAHESYNAIVNGDGSLDLAENEHSLGYTPWNPAVLDRQFTFINEENAHEFAKFQTKDLIDTLTTYTQRAVHRGEYAEFFGNDGEVIQDLLKKAMVQGATPEQIQMAHKATMGLEGTLGNDFNPRIKQVMSGLVTFQNIVLLPLSLFSNLIDPLGVAMRSNDMREAWKTFAYGIQGLVSAVMRQGPDEATEMAKLIGLIDDQNMLDAMGQVYNSMHMSRFMRNINAKFFKYNGMEVWNQRMRVAAMMAAQRFVVKNIDNKRYMDELGLTPDEVFVLDDGTLAMTKEQLIQAGCNETLAPLVEKSVQAAVFKWVDGAVLRPNAAHRPIWGSDPRFALIFHLKQYTYSFQSTILRRVRNELDEGNKAPALILASYVPFMFASDLLKGSLMGSIKTGADVYDLATQAVSRAGVLGTGVFGSDAMNDVAKGQLPGTSFLGPTADHAITLLRTLSGHSSAEHLLDRSVPIYKFL